MMQVIPADIQNISDGEMSNEQSRNEQDGKKKGNGSSGIGNSGTKKVSKNQEKKQQKYQQQLAQIKQQSIYEQSKNMSREERKFQQWIKLAEQQELQKRPGNGKNRKKLKRDSPEKKDDSNQSEKNQYSPVIIDDKILISAGKYSNEEVMSGERKEDNQVLTQQPSNLQKQPSQTPQVQQQQKKRSQTDPKNSKVQYGEANQLFFYLYDYNQSVVEQAQIAKTEKPQKFVPKQKYQPSPTQTLNPNLRLDESICNQTQLIQDHINKKFNESKNDLSFPFSSEYQNFQEKYITPQSIASFLDQYILHN